MADQSKPETVKKLIIFVTGLLLSCFTLPLTSVSQVAINADGAPPAPSAMLDVSSLTKGILPPRMTTFEMNSILFPAEGLLVYNTTEKSLFWFNGILWKRFNDFTFTEADPIFWAHPASTISNTMIANWNAAYSNRITSVSATSPLSLTLAANQLSGSMTPAGAVTSGYLTAADWNAFNSKVSSQWVTNGANIHYTAGRVGVGTSAPSYPFHVVTSSTTSASPAIMGQNTVSGANTWLYGVYGNVNSSASSSGPGIGVLGTSSNSTGAGIGVYGSTSGAEGVGIKGLAASSSGINYGIYAHTNSPDGYAGYFTGARNYFGGKVGIGTTNPNSPLVVTSDQSDMASTVINGSNTYSGTNPWVIGVRGSVSSSSTYAAGPGVGVYGIASSTTGGGVGVYGQANGAQGYAVRAQATSSSGVNYGIYSSTYSSTGFAGYFTGGKNYFEGNLGIGTISPLGRLHIHDPNSGNPTVYITPSAQVSGDSSTIFMAEDYAASYGMYWLYDGIGNQMELFGKNGATRYGPHLIVNRDNGSIAIGPEFATGYKLSVNGKIICTEVRVNLVADWPDYVFKPGYKLMPVRELGVFVDQNGHLPNIPPAAEIGKSGLEMGEMQRRMMEKIEELSLYIIQQQKEIDALKEQLNGNR